MNKSEKNLREMWDTITCVNIHVMGLPEGEVRGKETEKVFKEIRAENVPNLME